MKEINKNLALGKDFKN